MQRLSTTVLAVVGPEAAACVLAFADAANVTAVRSTEDGWRERADQAWRRTLSSHAPFTMHDADPLEGVAAAWLRSFDDGDPAPLEVLVAETVARCRSGTIGLPDYYLVLDPDELGDDRRHWYLGVLHRAAPHRVVPTVGDAASVRRAISGLGAGRWWPDVSELLDGLDRLLPDRLMTVDGEAEGTADDQPRLETGGGALADWDRS